MAQDFEKGSTSSNTFTVERALSMLSTAPIEYVSRPLLAPIGKPSPIPGQKLVQLSPEAAYMTGGYGKRTENFRYTPMPQLEDYLTRALRGLTSGPPPVVKSKSLSSSISLDSMVQGVNGVKNVFEYGKRALASEINYLFMDRKEAPGYVN